MKCLTWHLVLLFLTVFLKCPTWHLVLFLCFTYFPARSPEACRRHTKVQLRDAHEEGGFIVAHDLAIIVVVVQGPLNVTCTPPPPTTNVPWTTAEKEGGKRERREKGRDEEVEEDEANPKTSPKSLAECRGTTSPQSSHDPRPLGPE